MIHARTDEIRLPCRPARLFNGILVIRDVMQNSEILNLGSDAILRSIYDDVQLSEIGNRKAEDIRKNNKKREERRRSFMSSERGSFIGSSVHHHHHHQSPIVHSLDAATMSFLLLFLRRINKASPRILLLFFLATTTTTTEAWISSSSNSVSITSISRVMTAKTTNTNNDSRRRHHHSNQPLYFGEEDQEEEQEQEDWRDVRAKLIQQHRMEKSPARSINSSSSTNSTTSTTSTAQQQQTRTRTRTRTTSSKQRPSSSSSWAYDSGGVVEQGSLIVSHPVQDFACGGLRQQYFHKCVVLVVKHDETQFTKGVILNRPTHHQKSRLKDAYNNEWTVWFAGDVQGLHSSNPDYTCLHRLKSPKALEVSSPVVKDIQHTTWELAQLLVQQGEATPEDFWLGCGYAGWWPTQLQDELERGNWFMVATDSASISELLNTPENEDDDNATGIAMWNDFMTRIGNDHLVDEYSALQEFEDRMLTQWVQEQLLPSESGTAAIAAAAVPIQEGTIYRTHHPILFEEQVFHQSLVLILKTDERGIIGAILNRPSSKCVRLKHKSLPVRFGGRYGIGGEGKPETWLHCGNEALRNAKVGVPVVPEDESLVWQCSTEDAETAVEIGLASPSDFMAVLGLTLWEKHPPPEGVGLPLTKTTLAKDFSPVPKSAVPRLWKELLCQEISTEASLSKNILHSKTAYHLASDGDTSLDKKDSPCLADEALERWIKMFLIKEGEGDDA